MSMFKKKKGNHPRAEVVLRAIRAVIKVVREIEDRKGFSSAPDYQEELIDEANEKISTLKIQIERLSSGSVVVWKRDVLECVDDALRTRNFKDKQRFLVNAANVVDDYLKKN